MEFIKILKRNNTTYHIFYDENLKAINYFIYVKETGETDCITLLYNNIKYAYDVLTEKSFRDKYEEIMDDVLSQEDRIMEGLLNYQVFPKGFWEDIILRKFKGCKMAFVKRNN